MLQETLKNHNIILASGSPRRQQFLKDLEINFQIQIQPVEEVYPDHLKAEEITNYLSELKANAFKPLLQPNDILITSDTIVWHNHNALGKPQSAEHAKLMIASLSNDWHEVISSVSFTTKNEQITKHYTTRVHFKELTFDEIDYYVNTFNPLDKAGAYGIQEWIGLIGIDKIEGSYFNVVGLPTHIVYETLIALTKR
ncbi:Maf-like protein [Aquimarina agarivorans]|uniref:Maf-like protein n=1 Tax=Aquimarina agarivorans TaxID=980584 RepID=UPI000248E898|nr:Maf-like protein [Aquimarina agarivorans]